jgi:hypothetical protein
MDFTMTHPHYGSSHVYPIGHLTNIRSSDGSPEPDGVYIAFKPLPVDTSDHIYDDFLRLLFLHVHREVSDLGNDIPEETNHFRVLV